MRADRGEVVNAGTDTLIEIRVADRAAMDPCLDAAVDRMIEVALDGRSGILVTRLGDGHFTVEISDKVRFGYTEQLDYRNKSS